MCRLLAFWIALLFTPVRYNDGGLGDSVARFICKYVPAYFPIKVVFEDENAFRKKQAYGEWCLHSCSLLHKLSTDANQLTRNFRAATLFPFFSHLNEDRAHSGRGLRFFLVAIPYSRFCSNLVWLEWTVIAGEPHSFLPIGIVILTPQCGVLPVSDLRALATSAVSFPLVT
jgi:hypothetical protein